MEYEYVVVSDGRSNVDSIPLTTKLASGYRILSASHTWAAVHYVLGKSKAGDPQPAPQNDASEASVTTTSALDDAGAPPMCHDPLSDNPMAIDLDDIPF